MKNALFLIIGLVLFLIGCQLPINSPVNQSEVHYAIVKNSLWQTTKTITLDSGSRFITTIKNQSNPTYAEIVAEVNASNALALTNQEWVYLDAAPDISNAPNGNVFYCNPVNGIPTWSYLNLTRQYIFDHYQEFLNGANGQIVYIDHIPPPPILAKDSTPYEWYSIYVIEDLPSPGTILYEDHCGYNKDESFSGQWILTPSDQTYNGIPGGGWTSIDTYWYQTMQAYQINMPRPQDVWPGVTSAHLVTRQIYPPLPTPTIQP